MDNNKVWSIYLADGKMIIRNGTRLPRKTKKLMRSILDVVGENYVIMSMSLAKEYESILLQLKEIDGRATETV